MRVFEGVVIILGVLSLVAWWLRRLPLPVKLLMTAIACVVAGAQIAFQGYRFPMLPAYLLIGAQVVYTLLISVRLWRKKRTPSLGTRKRSRWLYVPLGLCLLVVVLLPVLLPVFRLEPPTGPFAVGTINRTWTYHAAANATAGVPAAALPLRVQFWYPVTKDGASANLPTVPYATPQTLDMAAAQSGIPAWLFDSVLLVHTAAIVGAPVASAQATYPVIVFLPGEGVPTLSYTGLLQDLASHGFIVAALSVVDPQLDAQVLHSQAFSDRAIAAIWLPRISFVLDRLQEIQTSSIGGPLTGRLDLRHIGLLGHSYGGAAVPLALQTDPRLSAGIDMDGIFYGAAQISNGVGKPFLYMDTSASHAGYTEQEVGSAASFAVYQQIWARRSAVLGHTGAELTLSGAWHLSFSDFGLYSPIVQLVTPLSQAQGHRIVTTYCVAFFQQNLAGINSPLLSPGTQPFPQTTLRVGAA